MHIRDDTGRRPPPAETPSLALQAVLALSSAFDTAVLSPFQARCLPAADLAAATHQPKLLAAHVVLPWVVLITDREERAASCRLL